VAGNEIASGKEAGLKFLFNEHGAILGNHIHHVGWAGIAAEGDRMLVARNRVHDSTRGGIFFTHAKYARVLENVVHDHPEWGLVVAEVTKGIVVRDNLAYGNGAPGGKPRGIQAGIVCMKSVKTQLRHNTTWRNVIGIVSFQSPDAEVFDNLIVENRAVGLHWHEGGAADYNALWGNGLMAQWIEKGARDLEALKGLYAHRGAKMVHALQADPQMVDPEAGDFRLGSGSPCRRAASDAGDIGADPGAIRETLAGACDRAAWLRGHLARAYHVASQRSENEGDREEALAHARRALLFSPGDRNLRKRLAAVEERE
jgi:hypothetical protein